MDGQDSRNLLSWSCHSNIHVSFKDLPFCFSTIYSIGHPSLLLKKKEKKDMTILIFVSNLLFIYYPHKRQNIFI